MNILNFLRFMINMNLNNFSHKINFLKQIHKFWLQIIVLNNNFCKKVSIKKN